MTRVGPPILGAVLAGGASSRFGSDKALAVTGGRMLLDHARSALAAVTDEVVVIGRGEVPDLPSPGLGPLGGIAGALDHGAHRGFASVLTVGCDMPELPEELIAALLDHLPSFCPDAPVLGHWPVTLADDLVERLIPFASALRPGSVGRPRPDGRGSLPPRGPGHARPAGGGVKEGGLSVRRWALSIGAIAIPSPAALRNVNTPADLPA